MASTFDDVKAAFADFTRTAWAAALTAASLPASTPLTYDNLNFDPPQGPWARLTVKHIRADRATLGSVACRFRREGQTFVQVFIPIGGGTQTADILAESLVEAFENAAAIDNIWFRNVRMREVGPDGTFYQVNVELDFTFDRIS